MPSGLVVYPCFALFPLSEMIKPLFHSLPSVLHLCGSPPSPQISCPLITYKAITAPPKNARQTRRSGLQYVCKVARARETLADADVLAEELCPGEGVDAAVVAALAEVSDAGMEVPCMGLLVVRELSKAADAWKG
jgi:hypothetical protein